MVRRVTEMFKTNELHDLIHGGKKYKRNKGQVIQSTAEQKTINLIKEGYVKRYLISNAGTLGVEVIYGPRDVFPLTLMYKRLFNQDIYEGPEVYYYEAMCDTTIYTLDIEVLAQSVKDNPLIYRELLSESAKRLHSTLQGLENMTLRSSYKRVAHQLYYFAHRFGERKLGGTRINIPLTHQDIADTLSLTRETVSTCMVQLRKKKLIITGRYIIVPNLQKLQEEGYS